MNEPRCKTCGHWSQGKENPDLGVCARLGGIVFGENLSINASTNREVTSDFNQTRTRAAFGCVLHTDYILNQISGTL